MFLSSLKGTEEGEENASKTTTKCTKHLFLMRLEKKLEQGCKWMAITCDHAAVFFWQHGNKNNNKSLVDSVTLRGLEKGEERFLAFFIEKATPMSQGTYKIVEQYWMEM